jgi:hypothetical protein
MSTHQEHEEVHVTALYTQTARKVSFVAPLNHTVQQVIEEAYHKLEESHRADDRYFCHEEPRVDLSPYLHSTLHSLETHGICLHDDGHGKLEFAVDIDAKPGGAA